MWTRASFDRILLTLLIVALAGSLAMFANGEASPAPGGLAQLQAVQGTTNPKPDEFRPAAARYLDRLDSTVVGHGRKDVKRARRKDARTEGAEDEASSR